MVTVIYCRGGDKDAPRIANFAGMAYGSRHDYTIYAPPFMLDVNWKRYEWADVLSKVSQHKPALIMVPDFERPDEQDRIWQQANDLKAAGAQGIMICPKFVGAVALAPEWAIVGISVPTTLEKYKGFLPDQSEVVGRRLHLLGGAPDQQLYLMRHKYPESAVISVDGNKLALKARKGQWWSARRADWIQAKPHQYSTIVLKLESARNIVRYLNDPASKIRHGKPVQMCMKQPSEVCYTAVSLF